jgi:uncharacterized protein (DUF1800 family)
MELHTLGVDGGYTQQDIVEVARAFTGWTIRPREGSGFMFVPFMHDRAEKRVLGRTIKAGGGVEDGLEVLDTLAAHPSTARFISRKLVERFVSENPPQALVDRAAARFTATKGDLREVVRTVVTSPEFFAADAYRAKVKTPLEFVASALRATGADVRIAQPLVRQLRDLGMPPYFCQPPTGYEESAATWVSSGALVGRMNFALELGRNRDRRRDERAPAERRAAQRRLRVHARHDCEGDHRRADHRARDWFSRIPASVGSRESGVGSRESENACLEEVLQCNPGECS